MPKNLARRGPSVGRIYAYHSKGIPHCKGRGELVATEEQSLKHSLGALVSHGLALRPRGRVVSGYTPPEYYTVLTSKTAPRLVQRGQLSVLNSKMQHLVITR